MSKSAKHVYISGRVQGVGFRYFTQRTANDLNLSGWVKNLADGRVEAVIAGPEEEVQKMIKQLKKGPGFARPDTIKVTNTEYESTGTFKIRY